MKPYGIRQPGTTTVHEDAGDGGTMCLYLCGETMRMTERVPIAQVEPADLCATCWPQAHSHHTTEEGARVVTART